MSKNMLPYPGKNESHDSWMRRCDDWDRNRKNEQESRWAGETDGKGLTPKQAAKLAKVEAKLPEGWSYTVTNDNHQVALHSPSESYVALATRDGKSLTGQTNIGAKGALLINRACAAVFGKQPCWYNWDTKTDRAVPIFTAAEWSETQASLR